MYAPRKNLEFLQAANYAPRKNLDKTEIWEIQQKFGGNGENSFVNPIGSIFQHFNLTIQNYTAFEWLS